jgi:hypothetical protein
MMNAVEKVSFIVGFIAEFANGCSNERPTLPDGAVTICDNCGAPLYPYDPTDEFKNVLDFRFWPGGECCHRSADGRSSLVRNY